MLLIHCCLSQKYELSKQQASVLLCMSVFNLWKVNCVVLAAEGRKAITVISHSRRDGFCVYRDGVYLHRLEITPFIVAVMSKEWHHYDYRIKSDCSWWKCTVGDWFWFSGVFRQIWYMMTCNAKGRPNRPNILSWYTLALSYFYFDVFHNQIWLNAWGVQWSDCGL